MKTYALCQVLCFVIGVQILLAASCGGQRIVCRFSIRSVWKFPDEVTYLVKEKLCTDIIFDACNIIEDDDTWEVDCFWRDVEEAHEAMAQALRSKAPTKFFLSFFTHENKWKKMAADTSKRMFFITSVFQYIEERGFHGLNLEWHRPGPSDRENYVKLVEELVERKPENFLLTGTVKTDDIPYYTPRNLSGFHFRRLSELFDWINVQPTIETGGDRVDVPSPLYRRQFDYKIGKHLYNLHDSLEIMVQQGAQRHKLMVPVSFMGISYTVPRKKEWSFTPFDYSLNAPAYNNSSLTFYNTICERLATGKWRKRFDPEGLCPYAFLDNEWMGFEDERSARIKMEYVKDYGYGGAYLPYLKADDVEGKCGSKFPLLHAVHSELHRNQKPQESKVQSEEEILCERYKALGLPINRAKCP